MKKSYTDAELVALLKERIGGKTLVEWSAEVGISFQLASDILRGRRSVGNPKVLEFLAPKGRMFVHEDCYRLVAKGRK